MRGSCILRSSGAASAAVSTGAISIPQFLDAFQRTWLESRRLQNRRTVLPRRLGLAVSGGADSMALAYLCKQWENRHRTQSADGTREGDDLSVTAFVVDHKARKESTQEANTVARWLRDMGITTQILELEWPSEESSKSAFETHARRLRFQALGNACRAHGIEALLMGHHQDDNVETTIWRLCSGARGAGLAGIPAVAKIPECHGLYGVSESGDVVTIHPEQFESGCEHQDQKDLSQKDLEKKRKSIPISTGGILICRPLLPFPKSTLLSTCHENNIPFVSDPTNFDPTLTPRNAIRALLAANRLPRALQNPSILSLIEKSQNLIHESHRQSDDILAKQCRLLDLSLESGTMTIQFSPSPTTATSTKERNPNEKEIELGPNRLHQIQSLSLRRLTELISPFPENHFPLRSFADFTQRVFPSPPPFQESPEQSDRKPFTLGGVMFQPLSSHHHHHHHHRPHHPSKTKPNPKQNTENNNHTWLLTRQPFMRHRHPILRFDLPVPPYSFSSSPSPPTPSSLEEKRPSGKELRPQYQAQQNDQQKEKKKEEKEQGNHEYNHNYNYTPWTLWDNRFWLRLALVPTPVPGPVPIPIPTPIPVRKTTGTRSGLSRVAAEYNTRQRDRVSLTVRPLQQSDLRVIRQLQRQRRGKGRGGEEGGFDVGAFLERLDRDALGLSRFTLPVLTVDETCSAGGHTPLALPTLDLWFPRLDERPWMVTWEWKYKMIDLDSLRLIGSL